VPVIIVEFMEDADTICAISTPAGEGGIGIVRISGKKSHSITESIFKPRGDRKKFTHLPRTLYLGYIINPNNNSEIDEVFTVFMNAPHTYTCEDIAEIHTHGGYAAQKKVLSLILDCGARLAEPGEFTKRAFLNGRIDLLQAESVLDIIHSETDEELHYALKYLQGGLSQKIQKFQETLRNALAGMEALIDFPEEDIDIHPDEVVLPLKKIKTDIENLVDSYYEGRGIKQGFEVLIAGKANVGKSSLLNALLLKERAIVTPIPGTTRDLIEDTIYLHGIKIKIIDTAGIREPGNVVEEEGIKRVKQKISEVDLIIWLLDGAQSYSQDDEEVFRSIGQRNCLIVINKIDLPQSLERNSIPAMDPGCIEISALKDQGLDVLKEQIFTRFTTGGARKNSALLITNLRHRDALAKVKSNIEKALLLKEGGEPIEFIVFELREGLNHLAEITGETCNEDILQEIFSRFCIGK
jgi:tRNA modification GTPase